MSNLFLGRTTTMNWSISREPGVDKCIHNCACSVADAIAVTAWSDHILG